MKSEPAQLPVPPPRKNAEKSKKSPKTTLDPKNAQLFIENFVNQVTIKNVISNCFTPIVIPKTTFYAILMLIASYLSPAVFLHFLKILDPFQKFPLEEFFKNSVNHFSTIKIQFSISHWRKIFTPDKTVWKDRKFNFEFKKIKKLPRR